MSRQQAFSDAIRMAGPAAPGGLQPSRRFAVYRNNVSAGLIGALGVRYPAVKRLVGDDFFAAMARAFALAHLPQSPALIYYGTEFPDFIAGFGPASGLAYLADVAQLESLWWQAYHAADVVSLPAESFAAIPSGELGAARFAFHPATAILRSAYPVVSILEAQRGDGSLSAIDLACGEAALIYRHNLSTGIDVIDASEAMFLAVLLTGRSLGDSITEGLDLNRALTRLISTGIITKVLAP